MCGVRLGSSFTAHLPTWYAFLAADERRLCVWVSSWTRHARLWSVCALEPVSCSLHSCSFIICLIAWYGKSSHFWSSRRDFGSLPSNYTLESLRQFSQKKCSNFFFFPIHNKFFFLSFFFLLLFNYSCMPFLPIPSPHPRWTHFPPPSPPSPVDLFLCPL